MKLLYHDMEPQDFQKLFPHISKDIIVVGPGWKEKPPHTCIGCFGCWTKSPGHCVIRDGYGDMSPLLGESSQLILISQIIYGGYSPFIKTLLDRNIGYILPFFCKREGEMHHQMRYPGQLKLSVYGYGDQIEPGELETIEMLVKANGLNLDVSESRFLYSSQMNLADLVKEELQ